MSSFGSYVDGRRPLTKKALKEAAKTMDIRVTFARPDGSIYVERYADYEEVPLVNGDTIRADELVLGDCLAEPGCHAHPVVDLTRPVT